MATIVNPKNKPTPLGIQKSLYPTCEEREKMKMLKEVKETQDALKAAGIKATVIIEAEM